MELLLCAYARLSQILTHIKNRQKLFTLWDGGYNPFIVDSPTIEVAVNISGQNLSLQSTVINYSIVKVQSIAQLLNFKNLSQKQKSICLLCTPSSPDNPDNETIISVEIWCIRYQNSSSVSFITTSVSYWFEVDSSKDSYEDLYHNKAMSLLIISYDV